MPALLAMVAMVAMVRRMLRGHALKIKINEGIEK
jgi:hypothetical protein